MGRPMSPQIQCAEGEQLKVLIVHNGLGTGGAERSLAELLPGLADHGVRPLVACLLRRPEGVQAEVLQRGFDVRFLSGVNLIDRVRELRCIIALERPDLVHTTIFESDLVGRLAAVGGPPVLTSLVNTSYDRARRGDPNVRALSLLAARTVDGWTARHLTAGFHALTQAVKDAAVDALGIAADRITVIKRGRDPVRLGLPGAGRRRHARAAFGLRDDDEVILNVARQEFQKGQRYLLEAVSQLAAARPRLVLLIAGRRGHASRELEQLCDQRQLRGRVRLLGNREDIPDLLAAADVFAFPSLFEGLGGALIEAMALGLPIVASDLPAVREVVVDGGNALLVPARSPRALAAALATFLDDPSLARAFGHRGRTIFERHFTMEQSTRQMVALYERVVGMRDTDRNLPGGRLVRS